MKRSTPKPPTNVVAKCFLVALLSQNICSQRTKQKRSGSAKTATVYFNKNPRLDNQTNPNSILPLSYFFNLSGLNIIAKFGGKVFLQNQ